MEDLTGKQFGAYQIVAPLGEGGMAAVYKAYQPSMERFVALKVLPRHMSNSEEFVARFRREAKLLAQLQHPHILPVFDYGEAEGYPYIVMPFVQSGTLSEFMQQRKLSLPEIRRIITQIGDALNYAHTRGMIHRDVKPSNVLIDEGGNCLLTDFGLARMAEASTKITSSSTVLGTPAYMSPEQGTGSNLDQRSDIYSLGIILYEMVTGRVPFTAETPVAVVFKHIQDPLPSARKINPDLPESVELVLLKALEKNPADRYQTAEEFVHAMQTAITEDGRSEKPVSQVSRSAAPTMAPGTSSGIKQPIVRTSNQPRFILWAVLGIGFIGIIAVAAVAGAALFGRKFFSSPTAISAVTESIAPTNPPMPLPTFTEQPIATALIETPSDVFQDDFDRQLAEGWTWLNENPSKWSLTNVSGALQLMVVDASFDGPALPSNILLREPPTGDFEITTSVRFEPTTNFQAAGLVVFLEQGNVIFLARAFCDVEGYCLGDGIYFDEYENAQIPDVSPQVSFREPVTYLRLQRIGNTYIAFYSADGENWTKLGEHARDFGQIRVGLVAAQSSAEIPAIFDYFSIKSLQP